MSARLPFALKGGVVVDSRGARRADVLVRDGLIAAVGSELELPSTAALLDASGAVVSPGLVDLHAHLRQPGNEEAETVETAARAAALGGYTAIVAMPNTEPAIDSAGTVREVLALADGCLVEVAVAGAITVGRRGCRLAPMAEMAALGVRLFTDDGVGVQDGGVMRRALDYGRGLGVTLAQHCEDATLGGGVMHEGAWSSLLGLPGSPAAAEEAMVGRDLALVRATRARCHFLHLSTAGSVALVRQAKAQGLPVTAEATPHHLTLTDGEVRGFDPVFKVNPPLRPSADVDALRAAVAEGTVDAVATDHAPHTSEAKERPFDQAAPGTVGLETALAVTLRALCPDARPEDVSFRRLLAALSWVPAGIAGLGERQGGPIEAGRPANLCVFDPSEEWTVEPSRLASRSRNTAFAGRRMKGRVRHTLASGEAVVIDGVAQR